MKVAFISGPYRSKTVNGIFENIMAARAIGKLYWDKGYAVITPHLNSMFMDDGSPDQKWLDGDLAILERCDAIVMMPGYENSQGAMAELKFAQEEGLEVIYHK